MKSIIQTAFTVIAVFLFQQVLFSQDATERQNIPFNSGWKFINMEDMNEGMAPSPFMETYNDKVWKEITLPHTAYIEPLVIIKPWQGESWYRKSFSADNSWKGKIIFINFEAAMQVAEIWLNGNHIFTHKGGYLPFSIDISKGIHFGKSNLLCVLLDNREKADIPPGKPISELDFCYYSGIYRNVSLTVINKIHITDPFITNDRLGGTYVTFPKVSEKESIIHFRTQIANENTDSKLVYIEWSLIDNYQKTVGYYRSPEKTVFNDSSALFEGKLVIEKPELWSPENPALYRLQARVFSQRTMVDANTERIGIRKLELAENEFLLNGKPLRLFGTNRHQEYPYIGNALPDNAQYRDAIKIREAGFNLVRLSHYPQSPAFMAACDELGLLVINCIPGWQFFGNEEFEKQSYQDARELIRRDRNHACVALWELSINETSMPDHFMQKMTEIANEESPDQKLLTCGWINKFYDLYIPARQHAKAPDYWKKHSDTRPFFTAEYGDWEYYAQNAGFNQTGFSDLKEEERTSRQLRGDGEKRLLQQAFNFQEAHNDNLKSANIGDANWLMFDYNRGYAPDIESSGIMDIFRLPKYAYYFYQSQRSPAFKTEKFNTGPIVKIASDWHEDSDTIIRVFSNCEEVALYLDDKLILQKQVERDRDSDKLLHPPFLFQVKSTGEGTLKAVAYIKSEKVAEDVLKAAGEPAKINLTWDKSSTELQTGDIVFVNATVCDKLGVPLRKASIKIQFSIEGDAELIGNNPMVSEAGISTIILKCGTNPGEIKITASADNLTAAALKLQIEK